MQDLADDFDAFLTREPADDEGPTMLADEADADRLLRRVRGIERAMAKLDAFITAERAQLEAFYDSRSEPLMRDHAFALRALEGWMRGVHALDKRVLSVTLPCGTVSLRKLPERLVIEDVPQLAAWLEANGHPELVEREVIVKVKATPTKALLKAGPMVAKYEDGETAHKAMHGDEVVPNALLIVPAERRFGHKVTGLAAVTEPGDNAADSTEPPEEQ